MLKVWMRLWALLALTLVACNGSGPATTQDATAPTLAPSATGTSAGAPPSQTLEIAAGCVASEGNAVFTDEETGYCFAYPSVFVAEGLGRALMVRPASEEAPPAIFMAVNVSPADGRTASTVVDEMEQAVRAEHPELEIERSTLTLGGEEAEVIGVPNNLDFSREVVVVHDGMLFRLSFPPFDPAEGGIFAQAETLYDTATNSMLFLP